LTLGKKSKNIINFADKLASDLEDNAHIGDENLDILVKLLDGLKDGVTLYSFTNMLFTYIYGYLNRYANDMAPVINESFKRFKVVSTKSLFKQNFIKK